MSPITSAIQALQAALPNQVTLPTSPSYTTHLTSPWSQTCHLPPGAFIHLTSPSDVSTALEIVKKHGVRFAVRTTGHNPNEGFSSVDGEGVVFDLSGLKDMEMLEGGDEVRVGAGCTWGDVYGFVEGRGRSVVGGRDGAVGVGGFLLGGGLGAFPNLYGLGTDNIRAIELTTSPNQTITASANQHPALFTALKGGGSNFGIITAFTLATHPPLHVTWSISLFAPTDFEKIHAATLQMQKAMEEDKELGGFVNFQGGFVAVGMLVAEDKEKVDGEGSGVGDIKAFERFEGLDKMMAVAEGQTGTLGDLAKGMSHAAEEKKRYVGTLTTKPSESFYNDIYHHWQTCLKELPEGAILHYTIQPVGSQAVKYGQEQGGGNIMNLQAVSQVWWVFTAEWPSSISDAPMKAAVDSLVDKATSLAKEQDLFLDYLCASFASGKQDVLGSYGSESLRRMRDVSREWDGEGVFQRLQNGGFLLRACK